MKIHVMFTTQTIILLLKIGVNIHHTHKYCSHYVAITMVIAIHMAIAR